MKIKRDDLQSIIEQAEIPEEWKKILQETMKSVINRNDSVLAEIRNRVLQEAYDLNIDWSKIWNITTALVSADEAADLGSFRNILYNRKEVQEEYPLGEPQFIDIVGNYFLDCSYEDACVCCFDEYSNEYPYSGSVNIQGVATPFRYRLVFDLRYVNAEQILFNISDIYQIKMPVIFSPYGRRAVKIQIPKEYWNAADILRENVNDLTPYCLTDNKLKNKLVADKRLMWNIRTESVNFPQYNIDDSKDNSYFAPYGDHIVYRYEFKNLKENEFICPGRDDIPNILSAQITEQKNEQRQMITLEASKQLTLPCTSLRIMKCQENIRDAASDGETNKIFSNLDVKNKYTIFSAERLRTRGDIERVLYGLSMPMYGLSCSFLSVSDVEKKGVDVIRTYYRELKYGSGDSSLEQFLYGNRRRLPFCYLKFIGVNKFLSDYASFVLSFLSTRYPDFQWVGVK